VEAELRHLRDELSKSERRALDMSEEKAAMQRQLTAAQELSDVNKDAMERMQTVRWRSVPRALNTAVLSRSHDVDVPLRAYCGCVVRSSHPLAASLPTCGGVDHRDISAGAEADPGACGEPDPGVQRPK
jgi:hypothetical protein